MYCHYIEVGTLESVCYIEVSFMQKCPLLYRGSIVVQASNHALITRTTVMVPGSVIEVQAVNVSSSALRISWLAPEDGDRVDLYRVTVTIGSGDIMAIREDKNLFVIIDGLGISFHITCFTQTPHSQNLAIEYPVLCNAVIRV